MPKNIVVVVTRMRAKEGMEENIKQMATSLAIKTHAEPGNKRYDLYQNTLDKTYFILHEVWRGMGAVNEHMKTPHFNEFMQKSPAALVQPATDVEGVFEVTIATPFDPAKPPTTSKVIVATRMRAKEGMLRKTKKEAHALAAQTHAEAGSISYDLYQNTKSRSLFFLFEVWKGFPAVQVHMSTTYFGAFMNNAPSFLTPPTRGAEGVFEVNICVPYVPA